jgi:nitrile hydratase
MEQTPALASAFAHIVLAPGEVAKFKPGDFVRVMDRAPIGHYRVPTYLRGRIGLVERIIQPMLIDNEEEGFGRNAGVRRHYYRVAFPMSEVWSNYPGSLGDGLYIEVFENWLEKV